MPTFFVSAKQEIPCTTLSYSMARLNNPRRQKKQKGPQLRTFSIFKLIRF